MKKFLVLVLFSVCALFSFANVLDLTVEFQQVKPFVNEEFNSDNLFFVNYGRIDFLCFYARLPISKGVADNEMKAILILPTITQKKTDDILSITNVGINVIKTSLGPIALRAAAEVPLKIFDNMDSLTNMANYQITLGTGFTLGNFTFELGASEQLNNLLDSKITPKFAAGIRANVF